MLNIMGYTTEFEGRVEISPPLNEAEIAFLKKFSDTRRMDRRNGPYFVDGTGFKGQHKDADVIDQNSPPDGQPGLWCNWVPTDDGTALEWNGSEKFYSSVEWMQYLIDHFLKPGCEASWGLENGLSFLTADHVLNGVLEATGEERDDVWDLVVKDNIATAVQTNRKWLGWYEEEEEEED